MTQDEVRAMFQIGAMWKATIIRAGSKNNTVTPLMITKVRKTMLNCMTDCNTPFDIHFPTKSLTIEAKPDYLHYTTDNGDDIVLEKICSSL